MNGSVGDGFRPSKGLRSFFIGHHERRGAEEKGKRKREATDPRERGRKDRRKKGAEKKGGGGGGQRVRGGQGRREGRKRGWMDNTDHNLSERDKGNEISTLKKDFLDVVVIVEFH